MLCMTDFARAQAELTTFVTTPPAGTVSRRQGRRHPALRQLQPLRLRTRIHLLDEETGYTSAPCWHVGENLAWGSGEYGTVRSIFRAWMASPDHRANILGDYSETGVSVQVGTLGNIERTRVWTEHFGRRCE